MKHRFYTSLGILSVATVLVACGGEDFQTMGAAGAAGNGGTAGNGGSAGDAGSGGSAATGGAGGSSAAGGDAGSAGVAGSAGDGGTCDGAALPGDDDCVIDDQYGVFIAPSGDDTSGNGSMATPYATLGKGMAEAKSAGKRIYACADGGAYTEQLVITSASAGVSAFGSFSCADWSYNTALQATVAPTTPGVALDVDSANSPTRIEGFEFRAQGATQPGESSVAAFVKTSSGLSLVRVKLVAGDGMAGPVGARTDFTQPTGLDGNPGKLAAQGMVGGASKPFTCPGGGVTVGASGGTGDAATPAGGGDGTPTLTVPKPNGGKGGTGGLPLTDCIAGGGGATGNVGSSGTQGVGAARHGELTISGWQPEAGSTADPGTVGQGGGGGRGGSSGGGGGGGAGGCGGAAGGGGGGGGASIALLLVNSPLVLTDAVLVSGDAGDGGKGSDGQDGLAGGFPGNGIGQDPDGMGCNGGGGGRGGPGGGGGGGAGGLSVGILHLGEAPTTTGGSITLGSAGAAGLGGKAGTAGGAATSGVAGVAEDVRAVSN